MNSEMQAALIKSYQENSNSKSKHDEEKEEEDPLAAIEEVKEVPQNDLSPAKRAKHEDKKYVNSWT